MQWQGAPAYTSAWPARAGSVQRKFARAYGQGRMQGVIFAAMRSREAVMKAKQPPAALPAPLAHVQLPPSGEWPAAC